nr:cellulase family glycosylhydrolase [Micromonospora sp. DSM 115978]
MTFSVADGTLTRDGRPFLALGVNYHPSRAGCLIWSDWDPAVLERDFTLIADSGLNTVRLFLFWRDFQPGPDRVDPVALDRLDRAVTLAGAAGLGCVLSIFTVWMNGQLLDLPWRDGRDPWRDETLLDAEHRYAAAVARTLRRHPHVLAYDLGDELWNIDPDRARALSRHEVAAWQTRLAEVIRRAAPGALVLQANDASGVFGSGPYGVDNSAGLDLIGIHGFPTWAPGSIESTASYKATNLVPFLVRVAAAYGVPLVDEFGAYGVDEPTAADYLGAAAASAIANGATGLLWWSWQDVVSTREPYRERPAERLTGLHRADGTPKPTMARLRAVADSAGYLAVPRGPARAVLYLPERVRGGGRSYLDTGGGAVPTFYSYLLLKRAHLDVDVSATVPAGRSLILCPAPARLTLADVERLGAAATAGATVYLSLGDHLHGFAGEALTGARIVDWCGPEARSAMTWYGQRWVVDWSTSGATPTTLRATSATVLASFPDGTPALVENAVGAGRVIFTNLPVEAALDRPGRLTATGWERFYRRIAERAGVVPSVLCDEPDLEFVSSDDPARPGTVVVNHASHPVRAGLVRHCDGEQRQVDVDLPAKGWTVLRWG